MLLWKLHVNHQLCGHVNENFWDRGEDVNYSQDRDYPVLLFEAVRCKTAHKELAFIKMYKQSRLLISNLLLSHCSCIWESENLAVPYKDVVSSMLIDLLWYKGCSKSNTSYFIMSAHNIRDYVGCMAVEVEPFQQYSTTFCCCDKWQLKDSQTAWCQTWKCGWSKSEKLTFSTQEKWHPVTFVHACWNIFGDQTLDVNTVVHFSSGDSDSGSPLLVQSLTSTPRMLLFIADENAQWHSLWQGACWKIVFCSSEFFLPNSAIAHFAQFLLKYVGGITSGETHYFHFFQMFAVKILECFCF